MNLQNPSARRTCGAIRPPPTRRLFLLRLAGAGGTLALAGVAPGVLRGQGTRPGALNRVALVVVGAGEAGLRQLDAFLAEPDCQVVAVCDVDQLHAEAAKDRVNRRYGNRDCRVYYDYRAILARPDVDAVALALPDHWHALVAVQAVRAGFDVYSEAPLAHSVREGQAIRDAVRRYGRCWQTGGSLRLEAKCRQAAALSRLGRLGRLQAIEVGFPGGHADKAGTAAQTATDRPPSYLDYDLWLGPAPWAPYCPARVHGNWRWHLDYGGGALLEAAGSQVDLALWGMTDPDAALTEVEADGEFPEAGLWNAPTRCRIAARYKNGVVLRLAGGQPDIPNGIRWVGERGWVHVDGDAIQAEPGDLLRESISSVDLAPIPAPNPYREFLDCVRTRRTPGYSVEAAQRATAVGHLGLIALSLGRPVHLGSESEEIPVDPTAARLLGTSYREPWRL